MKFHLPVRFYKALMAVVCVPGTTIAGDVLQYEQPVLYTSSGVIVKERAALAASEAPSLLYWDSVAGESAVWDTDKTAAWLDSNAQETTCAAGAQVVFGEGANLNKSVQIAPEGVTASTVKITGSGYRFSDGDMVVTERLSAEKSATLDSVLVIGSTETPLHIDVADGEQLTTRVLETIFSGTHEHHIYEKGSFEKNGNGTLTITEAVHGAITGATVNAGVLELAPTVSLDVGANEILGGSLENVEMLITGEVDRPVSGNVATAHNIIKSADGVNAAVLTDVTLHAGMSTEYATIQNVSFDGESILRGYITFEKTQKQRDMSVAAGGSLTVDNVCFDLHGLSAGEKVLIENAAVNSAAGTLTGWDTASFVYSGIAVNSAAVDSSVAGVVTINREHSGNLYWTGAQDYEWNPGSANWSTVEGGTGGAVFTALSNVYFGAGAANRDITVMQDLVVMDFGITGGDYSFSGGRIATLGDAAINTGAEDSVTFHDLLVVQGSMTTSGKGTLELLGDTTVVNDLTLGTNNITIDADVTVLSKFNVNAGSDIDAGTLNIYGNVTAQEMNIAVSAGEEVGNSYHDALVNVTGNLTVGESGSITIGGTAEQHYLGVVRAGNLTVNTQEHDVYFDHLHVGSLTVGQGAHVHVLTSTAAVSLSSSEFPVINLSGTLALDARGVTYDRGYDVYLKDDAASLFFGSGCTIDNMKIFGMQDDSGYTNVDIEVQSRSATVTQMQDLGDLKVGLGSVTAKNAEGAVHGELILDNGKLKLGEGSDNLMDADSGAVRLENGGHLDIGTTTQTFSANNEVFLSGAASITGDAKGPGLQLADGLRVNYADAGNSIDTKMTLAKDLTLNSSSANSSLEISGAISGSGALGLTGQGTVAISGANTDFDGQVTVQQGSTLSLQNTEALVNAGVTLNAGSTLAVDTLGTANVNELTFLNGSSLAISNITGTDESSVSHALLNANQGVTFAGENVTMNVIFSEKLETLTAYNLMTGVTSIDNLSFNVKHNGADLDASQYRIELDDETGLLYIYTMMGNVWEGKGNPTYGYYYVWSTTDKGGQWSSGNGNYDETGEYKAAIFGDLDGGSSTISVYGTVNPGDVYFIADETDYVFNDYGSFAAGTNLHKDGEAKVTLQLYQNMDANTALGSIDIKNGSLVFMEAYAVSGAVTIDPKGKLVITGGDSFGIPIELKMGPQADGSFNYTVSGLELESDGNLDQYYCDAELSGVTLDASSVYGKADAYGSVYHAYINGNADISYVTIDHSEVTGATLSNVSLYSTNATTELMKGYYRLQHVTFGENVVVEAGSRYSINGNITFKDTIVNKGVIHITNVVAEIGQIDYTFHVADNGKSTYDYRFIRMEDGGRFDILGYNTFETRQVEINGINLATGLATGIGAEFVDNKDGSFTLSVGKILAYDKDGNISEVDGTVGMPQWDERWGKQDNAPGMTRRYFETDATADFSMASGISENPAYYKYNSIVNGANAAKVNKGRAIAVTLSSVATGNLAAGGSIVEGGLAAADHEVWIYDRSGFKTVIGGLANWAATPQFAATHVLVNTDNRWMDQQKELVIGGSRWSWQYGESFVTVQNGNINKLVGGSYEWVEQEGTAHVFVDGGTIGEIFAAGYLSTLHGTQMVDGRTRAVEMTLTGGTLGWENGRVFGGGDKGTVNGDIYIRMEGDANVRSQLVGGSNAGTVNGDIVLDLISGTANRVDAAGLGWDEWTLKANTNGNVLVNLYTDFRLGDGLYGGKEQTNYVTFGENKTSTLHFAESGKYELASIGSDGYTASADSAAVTGFDRITLADGAHAVVALEKFDHDMDADTTLSISGQGVVEVIGHGANFGRDILLQDGATLKVSTSVIGLSGADDDRTITVTEGSSIDFSGFPVETHYDADSDFAGLGFNVLISGNGANGMGALYKGKYENSLYPKDEDVTSTIVNRIVLPNVKLTDSASVGVVEQEYLFMNANALGQTQLDLAGHTLTKLGAGDFITRSVEITPGTILVQQGAFGSDLVGKATDTDMVLAAGTELKLDSTRLEAPTGTTTGLELRSLSGSGTVTLNGSTLTLHTDKDASYYAEYMDGAQTYNQFSETTGFGYAVFSGLIKDGSDKGKIAKTGSGVHYISGSSNTYTGGTQVQEGRLYLLGTGVASEFSKGESRVASGVAGTGAIVWGSAKSELYLGHNARIYNEGTTNVAGGVMTIGVEGAPNGVLADFVGIHSKGTTPVKMNGVEYVEIETHSLKSIAVNATYADGTEYVAHTDIDHNKMLLVKKSDWESAKNTAVTGFSDTGYNEAVYSGVLFDSNNVAAKLHKVGVGTLVLDQSNSYTGGTEIDAGTLRVRGWGSLGKSEKTNAVNVHDGATLMFTHNSGYGNEPTSAANDITIAGSGDERWLNHAATDGETAALISAVGPAVTFTLSGDIVGTGNVRHSGEGVLVLSGDNAYTGGTYASRGTVEVQSATGLGATENGQGAVTIEHDAALRVTVESGYTEDRMVTTLAADSNEILGDIFINGTSETERILHMASNGYNAISTTLTENGTLLLNGEARDGAAVKAESAMLTGSGKVVVSDAAASGASITFDSMIDYTGDFRVEGDNASINVKSGTFVDGSIYVVGSQASVNMGSDIFIADAKTLNLTSTGDAYQNTAAAVKTEGAVSIEAGGILSAKRQETTFSYNIRDLQRSVSFSLAEATKPQIQTGAQPEMRDYHLVGDDVFLDNAQLDAVLMYDGQFDASIAANLHAAGVIQAKGGLTLTGGSTYETVSSHTCLMGGSLTLDTKENSLLTFHTTADLEYGVSAEAAQLVLFSGVGSVYFGYDEVTASSASGIYYTKADRYITGSDYIDDRTLLVYDSYAGVVYLQQAVPEPTTATLSLLALAGLVARRRRK